MLRPVHFEIHASDPAALRAFYGALFGWTFQQWSDNPYWLVMTADPTEVGSDSAAASVGINGGLMERRGPKAAEGQPMNSWVVTVDVPDCAGYVSKAVAAGGSVALEMTTIPGVGYLAYVKDPDGNIFGIMENNDSAG